MADFEITGAEDLERLGIALKGADKTLRKELLARIRAANKPLVAAAKAAALAELPKHGGLAAKVARSRFGTRTRLTGNSVGIRVVAKNAYSISAIDQGRLRHPLFGNRSHWYSQPVTPGWFEESMEHGTPLVRKEIEKAMSDVAARIEREA